MANARLHVICGNCGCNDLWQWEHIGKEVSGDEVINAETVWLWCGNCATLHDINDNAEPK